MGSACMKVEGMVTVPNKVAPNPAVTLGKGVTTSKQNQVLSIKETFLGQKHIKTNQKGYITEKTFQQPSVSAIKPSSANEIDSIPELSFLEGGHTHGKCSLGEELDDSWVHHHENGTGETLNLVGGKQVLKEKEGFDSMLGQLHNDLKLHVGFTSYEKEVPKSVKSLGIARSKQQETSSKKQESKSVIPMTKDNKSFKSMHQMRAAACISPDVKIQQAKKNLFLLASNTKQWELTTSADLGQLKTSECHLAQSEGLQA